MKRFICIFFLAAFIPNWIYSQNINGSVYEESSDIPITNVNVYFTNLAIGTYTNLNGEFSIRINKKNITKKDSITFSHLNYETLTISYDDFLNNNKIVYLDKSTETLSEVELNYEKKLRGSLLFEELSSLKIGVHNFGSQVVNNKIYVSGGEQTTIYEGFRERTIESNLEYQELNSITLQDLVDESVSNFYSKKFSDKLQIYDIEKNKWSIADSITLEKRAYHNMNLIDDNLFIIGGKTQSRRRNFEYLSNIIEVYNIPSKMVKIDKTIPHQSVNFTSAVYKNDIITIGGSVKVYNNGNLNYATENHVFDTNTGKWFTLDLNLDNYESKGVCINDTLYLLTLNQNRFQLKTIDLISNEHTEAFNLRTSRPITAITSFEEYIYFYGQGSIFVFNTNDGELKQYFINISVKEPNLHVTKEKLYIIGGYLETDFNVDSVKSLYSIDLNEFNNTSIVKYVETEL